MHGEIKTRKRRFWAVVLALVVLFNSIHPEIAKADDTEIAEGNILKSGAEINFESAPSILYLNLSDDILKNIDGESSHKVRSYGEVSGGDSLDNFVGWKVTEVSVSGDGSRIIKLSPYIAYEVSVSANPEEGGSVSVSGDGTYEYGTEVTVTATENTGYQFVEWTEGGERVSTAASYTFPAESDRDLVAKFEKVKHTVSVSADPTAGGNVSVSGDGTYEYGTEVTVTATENTGYQFVEWTEGGKSVSTNASYTFTAESDRTLVAKFEKVKHTVSVSANPTEGGSVSGGGTYEYGTEVTVTATPNEGYRFVKWIENATVLGTDETYSFTVKEAHILEAVFELASYKIDYVLNGGDNNAENPSEYTYGKGVESFKDATQTDHTFAGWYSDAEFTEEIKSIGIKQTGNVTLYAKFTPNDPAQTYKIEYEVYEGSNSTENPSEYTYGVGVGSFEAATQENHTFVGWYSDAEFTRKIESIGTEQTGDVTLYAKFEPDSYEITYEVYDGKNSTENPLKYTYGEGVEGFKNAEKENHTFAGWYSDAGFTTKIDGIRTDQTGDVTLYAKFEKVKHTVSVSMNLSEAGIVSGNGTYEKGATAVVTADANDGYKFVNWIANEVVVSKAASYSFTVTGDLSLTAVFEKEDVLTESGETTDSPTDDVIEGFSIQTGGKIAIKSGIAYGLGDGSWKITGDDTVYSGNITFYVLKDGEYDFVLQ